MIVIDKEHHECLKVDVMEVEKIEKNLGLSRKLKKVWNMKVIGIETKIIVLIHTSRIL